MRYCLALDLKDNDESIREYERWHQNVWPEVLASIRESGIVGMEIYRAGNRLFMIMETSSDFSFERKSEADNANPTVQQWEKLMWNFQKALPFAQPGEKWIIMQRIFSLD